MWRRALIAAVAAVACLLATGTAARADWTRVTSPSPTTQTGEVSLVRLPEGLHAIWRSTTASYRHRVDHRLVLPDATLGAVTQVAEDWIEMSDPALTAAADGLRASFGGLHTSHPDETNTELNTAVSIDGGTTWGLQDGSIVQAGTGAQDTPVAAAVQADGMLLAAWANRSGTWIHRGLDPSVPPTNIQAPLGPYGVLPGVATVGARTVVAWFSYSGSAHGVYAQEIAPNGLPAGNAVRMPGTAGTGTAMTGRTPVAGRVGGKVFVAYATGTGPARRIVLWSVGSATTRPIARASGPSVAAVTTAPDGAIWVAWTTRTGGRDRVMARRSDAKGTGFGAIIDAGRPPSGQLARTLDISAVGAELDVLAGYTKIGSSRMTTYHSRVGAG
jgi:hypothetical protein